MTAIDGVGHGREAAAAARLAVSVLERHAREPVITLIKRCHEALARTRGVVMTLAYLNGVESTVTWLGVGNVEGLLLRADSGSSHPSEHVLLRGGLVGYQLPVLHASVIPVTPGDLLVFATDGIRSDFQVEATCEKTPTALAAGLLERNFKGTDDALVLVVRYLGTRHE